MTDSAKILLQLLRAALGDETEVSLPNDVDWNEVIDISFEQGVAAIAVDGIGKATKTMVRQAHQPTKTAEALEALDSPELEDLKYEWLSPSGFSSFAPRQLSVLFNRLLSA